MLALGNHSAQPSKGWACSSHKARHELSLERSNTVRLLSTINPSLCTKGLEGVWEPLYVPPCKGGAGPPGRAKQRRLVKQWIFDPLKVGDDPDPGQWEESSAFFLHELPFA